MVNGIDYSFQSIYLSMNHVPIWDTWILVVLDVWTFVSLKDCYTFDTGF